MTIERARELIAHAPSFPKLRRSYASFLTRLFNKDESNRRIAECDQTPERYLTVHAFVMNAKSAAARTMERLATAVFSETGLPRNPQGKFRGENGLNVDKLAEMEWE